MATVLSGLARRWLSRQALPGWALLVVMIAEACLCVDDHVERWRKGVQAAKQRGGSAGEGLVICHNGLGYYAWLRSLLVDGDWSFDNEFDEHALPGDYVPPPGYRTPIGRRANQWSVGPACAWAVTIIPVHLVLKAWGGHGSPWPTDGYSLPYQLTVGVTSLLLSFLGLWLTYAICRQVARPSRAALAAALLWLGSTIVYYSAVEVSGAHGLGATATALLVWYWLKTYGSLDPRRWLVVGALVGAAALMRWQLATFAVLPASEAVLGCLRAWRCRNVAEFWRLSSGSALAAVGAGVAFLPQIVAWRRVYGSWLVCPIPDIAAHWLDPSWDSVLWSQDRSLWYWTPITLVACLGYVRLLTGLSTPKQRTLTRSASEGPPSPGANPSLALRVSVGRKSSVTGACQSGLKPDVLALLFLGFAVQVSVIASMLGRGPFLAAMGNYAGIHLAGCYGFRFLTEALIALAPGLALLLERASRRGFQALSALGFVLVLWNLLLVLQYNYGMLPVYSGVEPRRLLSGTVGFVANDPLVCLPLLELVGVLWLLLVWGDQGAPVDAPVARSNAQGVSPALRADGQNLSDADAPARPPRWRVELRWLCPVALVAGLLAVVLWPGAKGGFVERVYRDAAGRPFKYVVFVPHSYRGDRPYPLIVSLHGAGARGRDGWRPVQEGLGLVIRRQEAGFDLVAVFPQSQTGFWDADCPDGRRAMTILDEVAESYQVDPKRIYLTGSSMGGFGTWSLAARYPTKWAAIVPICGGGHPRDAEKIKGIPCWCFHGADDEVIPAGRSREMIQALKAVGGKARYDEYPGVGHNCWDKAYGTPGLFDWLAKQRLP